VSESTSSVTGGSSPGLPPSGPRRGAYTAYRIGLMLFLLLGLVQIFLAGLGVFDLSGKVGAKGETAFDPHRMNGALMEVVALLLFVLVLIARPGRRPLLLSLGLLVLMVVVIPGLAALGSHAAWVGGLHAVVGIGLLGLASRMLVEARPARGGG
jgi:hypothetical protein